LFHKLDPKQGTWVAQSVKHPTPIYLAKQDSCVTPFDFEN